MIKYIFRADARTRLGSRVLRIASRFIDLIDFSVERDFSPPRYLATE